MTTDDKLADLQRLSYDAGYRAGLEAAKMQETFNEGAVRMASRRGHYTIEPNVLNELWRDSSAARRLDALIREAEGEKPETHPEPDGSVSTWEIWRARRSGG